MLKIGSWRTFEINIVVNIKSNNLYFYSTLDTMHEEINSTSTIIVKSKKNYVSIVITVLILLVLFYKTEGIYKNFLLVDIKAKLFDVLSFSIGLYFSYQILWAFFGKTIFIIANQNLL